MGMDAVLMRESPREHAGVTRRAPRTRRTALLEGDVRAGAESGSVVVEEILPDGVETDENDVSGHREGRKCSLGHAASG
ncbi:hypothetical protein HSB1_32630 [Halogranum salarium B-1]|uniref:Uncharacterized protein n=1 Tax=Halogranum salarium B-1 TaxID=1210908 RepID=J3JDW6_9EURY|nr:hypothetical protein HSB1_32630 [Halogranum salarium B-1]